MEHLTSVQDLSNEEVMELIRQGETFKNSPVAVHPQSITMANLFYENSTRTHMSFEQAERRLGYQVLPFEVSQSSVNKGESLYDTVITLEAIGANALVIRHSQNEYYLDLLKELNKHHHKIHLINGGDGSGQHPSQCLLDMMTIYEEFKHFDGLKVAIIGDIKNSRVARSNAQLLNQLGSQVFFSGPEAWYDPQMDQYGSYQDIDQLIDQMDVVMLLRVQHERHSDDPLEKSFDPKRYHEKYGINLERYQKLQDHAILMHPGPINRDVELASELVESEKSRFVQQMENGVYMRMAILKSVIEGEK
ncbi:aspartate carbamoyltransferase catalytic subunit [Aerococcus urinae]|uniref:Aspartate carbamoyltransferase n=2 Tax=Aerococcus urinae TaxID=1376 RepID=A0A329NDS0_9LACT|nr:aspartate carbamoyltransferase catalytic subunit [Aerococcus urinae]MCY3032839.1 aspartate carbamoyltransferase catalytic subunit [Aerococcus urinae]MCY3037519.1 aspartate carbamoyltransferase catalytic subunit [Aerococcus urinae]MCY3044886.1 aspartate carbamoyltransferase catalytic subunit [Aerococcus urinae]MCY3046462.1 aspartate carbamoyltransferase catalytic subunit [Aerococcus urinae]MCY3048340.1 aspartate carbamoyltransferase catalytic subunit [Aerococcus urinae]